MEGYHMKVELLVSRAGAEGAQNRGDMVEVDAQEGQRMIDAGQAKLVRGKTPEKAVQRSKPEKAAK